MIWTDIRNYWGGLDRRARWGFTTGVCCVIAGSVALAIWLLRPNYQPLFSDLAPRDAATMIAELEKMKIPYRAEDDGRSILVPQNDVAKTRMKLMSKDLPLHGTVGFELFNNADFGMTDFVQKVNYQRALQGELARTILSLDTVQSARVHLAIPERGLFKKTASRSKASVTLALKPAQQLSADQVLGIQRLVAASVPEMEIQDVTVLDQRGSALSRGNNGPEGLTDTGGALESKKRVEDYFVHKLNGVLDSALGVGEAMVAVDVSLNFDQGKITTEEILGAKTPSDGRSTGIVVRERQSWNDAAASDANTIATGKKRPGSEAPQSVEMDYQTGRRVEHVVTAIGGIRNISVAVVTRQPLDELQLGKLRDLVAGTVGLNRQRGDTVTVQALRVAGKGNDQAEQGDAAASTEAKSLPEPGDHSSLLWALTLLLAASVFALLSYLGLRHHRLAKIELASVDAHERRVLGPEERERLLLTVRDWLNEPASATSTEG